MVTFPPVPAEVKPLAHLLKLAEEHDDRNLVVAYWARMSACLLALRMVPGKKSQETADLIRALLDWLEETKKANPDNEGITNETTAQAMIEEYALRLFEVADEQDREEIFNKNTVKTFYTCGMLMDVLEQFGTTPDYIKEKRKYAKWKAAYIHNCLKAGEWPVSGPPRKPNEERGIVHRNTLSEEELATYTKYTGPIILNQDNKDEPTVSSTTPPPADDNLGLNLPTKPDDNNFFHAPASSPVTPVVPHQPSVFTPSKPGPALPDSTSPPVPAGGQASITAEQIQKAQKYCKFATSALNYDDVKNAVDNLQKALNLLQLGREQ